ncbi:hypothetical protein F5880DRAFT_1638680 [Lentinula raphanica]|nr:hypothetical protein F5880DRAFT_1638680 [Lentinula raphanica]
MYLFRNIFMRGSLAVHVLLLLIIATAIALPMNSSTSEKTQKRAGKKARSDVTVPSSKARTLKKLKMAGSGFNEAGPSGSIHDAKSSETPSTPQELIIVVIIEGGKELWTRRKEVSSQANWFMAMLPVEQLANIDDDSDDHRDLWDEVYEVPRELLHGQDIDLDPKWKDSESWGNVLDETFDPLGHH